MMTRSAVAFYTPKGGSMEAMPPVIVSPYGVEFSYEAPAPQPKSMRAICEEVAATHGVSLLDLRSDRRHERLCVARDEAMWRCRQETTASLPMIGRALGNRHHSTILFGIRRHEERLAKARSE